MDVQKKRVVKSMIIIWILSLVAFCGSGIVTGMTNSDTLICVYSLVAGVYGILLGIMLAKQPQRKRKILLFGVLLGVSFLLSIPIIAVIGSIIASIVSKESISFVSLISEMLMPLMNDGMELFWVFVFLAVILAIEGILFGLLSSLITNKVCKK